jgi:hypothetical protein
VLPITSLATVPTVSFRGVFLQPSAACDPRIELLDVAACDPITWRRTDNPDNVVAQDGIVLGPATLARDHDKIGTLESQGAGGLKRSEHREIMITLR